MFINYFKIVLRNCRKHKSFTAINLAGLTIGMACCLLILQFVSFHLSFDQFHENKNNLYRVANDRYQNGKLVQHGTITYSAIGKAMNDDFEEVAGNTRMMPTGELIISYQDKKLAEQRTLAADENFFQLFSFPLLAGDKNTLLKGPHKVALCESLARKVFDSWWIMNNWLHDFAYRVELNWWIFGLSGLAALLIALVTVIFQALKAAMTNPVRSLRAE